MIGKNVTRPSAASPAPAALPLFALARCDRQRRTRNEVARRAPAAPLPLSPRRISRCHGMFAMPTARMTPLGMFIGSGAGRHDRSAELPRGIEQQRFEITHVDPRRHAVPATPDTILARG